MKRKAIIFWLLSAFVAAAETITLENGKQQKGDVIRTNTAAHTITIRTSGGISTFQARELNDETRLKFFPDATASSGGKTSTEPSSVRLDDEKFSDSHVQKKFNTLFAGMVGWILAIKIMGFIAWIWWVVAAFQTSVVWGIFMLLFQPITGFFLIFCNWQRAKGPFFFTLFIMMTVVAPLLWFNFFMTP